MFILLHFNIHSEDRQSPFIFFLFIQLNGILVVRQHFAKSGYTYIPFVGLKLGFFKLFSKKFSDLHSPTSPGSTLISESSQIVSFVIIHISKTRNINACRSASILNIFFISFDGTSSATAEMVIHHVMP